MCCIDRLSWHSNSDIIVRRSEVTLRADSVAKRFWAPERRTLFPNQARKGNFDSKSGPSDSNIARFGDRTRYRRLLQHNRPQGDIGQISLHELQAQKERPPRGGRSPIGIWLDDQAKIAGAVFLFLRPAMNPNAPSPVAKSGRAPGSGVAETSVTLTSSSAKADGTSKKLNSSVSDPVAATENVTS
jgi:hypothetical protein